MLWLKLDGTGPLHRQVFHALRSAILDGRFRSGEKLASTRSLAEQLKASRNTVLQAYAQLIAEGYATTRGGSGTFVADALPPRRQRGESKDGRPPDEAEPLALSAYGQRLQSFLTRRHATWSLPREPLPYDFRYGEPAYADLPLSVWVRLLGHRARRLSAKQLAYHPPGGSAELREALAGYLARTRGVSCSAEQIVVVQGSQQAIELTTRLLVDPEDVVVLEEPHYTGFSFCLAALGAKTVYVPVDEQGLCTDALDAISRARLACVTPSHQYPAGGVLSLPRRLALLEWASSRSAFVLEDDYDGEFRFDGPPVECLQALDRCGRVIYVGTTSKLLFPALRLGWLVVPSALVEHFRNAKAVADTGSATLEQLALADFISEGHLERHVSKSRARYAARRKALVDALAAEFGPRACVVGASAGLHVMLRLLELSARDVKRLREACRQRGVGVYPTAPFYACPPKHAELLIGYTSLSERAIREGIRHLREAVDTLC